MGEPHRFAAIARVKPKGSNRAKYRFVFAYHHQWCYGTTPIHALVRMITALTQPENAEIVLAELRLLDDKFEENAPLAVPCPFLAFLLGTSINTDFSDPKQVYVSSPSFEASLFPATKGNVRGATIIDVTDPLHPRYRIAGGSAEEYIRSFYETPSEEEMKKDLSVREWENNVVDLINKTKDFVLIKTEALQEARGRKPNQDSTAPDELATEPTTVDGQPVLSTPLADMSLTNAIAFAVESGDTSTLEELAWLPGKAASISTQLRSLNPFPDAALALFAKSLMAMGDAHLDLQGTTMASNQLPRLFVALDTSKLTRLNLSFSDQLNVDTLRTILPSMPNLLRINLMGCSSISDEDIVSLLQDYATLLPNVAYIAHPYFFALKRSTPFPHPFTFVDVNQWLNMGTLPFLNPSVIVRCVTDYFKSVLGHEEDNFEGLSMSNIMGFSVAEGLFCSYRQPDEVWSQRKIICKSTGDRDDFLSGRAWTLLTRCKFLHGEEQRFFAFVQLGEPETSTPENEGAQPTDAPEPGTDARESSPQLVAPPFRTLGLVDFLNEITTGQTKPAPQQEVDELLDIMEKVKEKHGMVVADEECLQTFMATRSFAIPVAYSQVFAKEYSYRW